VKESGVFLTAEWKHLLMLNYAVDPGLVEPFVPAGTEVDSFEGCTYVSLVGFEFNDTRVGGLAIPFHRSFEEVNLRFYVRRRDRRGVVFIRELVPKFAVAAIARAVYGESYLSTRMSHCIQVDPEKEVVAAEYAWRAGSTRCCMRVETEGNGLMPQEGSLGQFITEHYWGYAARGSKGSLEYEVRHPRWTVRNAKTAQFSGDAARFYGHEFAKVLAGSPDSAFLADGSAVTVFRGCRIQ
jgi:uncharacterized protein YqjF (DUF2071 family)